MSERICFLHVGTVKTGSSALQYALAQSHADLLARGYNFAESPGRLRRIRRGDPTSGNAADIQRALRSNDVNLALALVRRYAETPGHLVFSSETLLRSVGAMEEFCSGLRALGLTPKCLVLFRPQTELLVSAYLQLVKSNIKDLPATLDQYAVEQDFEHTRNWYGYAQRLEHAFGAEHLTVKWYPALQRTGGIVKVAFEEWLGVPAPAMAVPQINPTPGHEAFTILQIVNSQGWGGRKFADRFLTMAEEKALLGRKIGLSVASADYVYKATLVSNEALIRRYCPALSPDHELQPPRPYVPAEPDKAIMRRLVKIAAELLVEAGHPRASIERAFNTFELSEI